MQNAKLASAIEKFRASQSDKRAQQLSERKAYLVFCRTEAEKIFDSLVNDIVDDLEIEGVSYINAIEKYNNIFQFRIGAIVADILRENGLELTLFPACCVIKVSVSKLPKYAQQ